MLLRNLFQFSFVLMLTSCSAYNECRNSLFGDSSQHQKSDNSVKISTDKYYHQVKFQGETLSIIAGWYTGSTKNWEKIAQENNLNAPYTIELGQVLKIPNVMLNRFEPLPEQMIERKTYLPEKLDQIKRASLKRVSKNLELEKKLKKLEIEKSLSN